MSACDEDVIDRLSMGELSAEEARRARAHVSVCRRCRTELAWLHAERELFSQRARLVPAAPARSRPRRDARIVALAAALVLAWATVLSRGGEPAAPAVLASVESHSALEQELQACLIASPAAPGWCSALEP